MIQGSSELTELFELEPAEELLERFACALLQTYSCTHNDFTPEQQVGTITCLCLPFATSVIDCTGSMLIDAVFVHHADIL